MGSLDKLTIDILILTFTAGLGKCSSPNSSYQTSEGQLPQTTQQSPESAGEANNTPGLELRGGLSGEHEGNIFLDGRPICHGGFSSKGKENALVVCRMLGFPNGNSTEKSFFGNISQDFIMDNFHCNGSEKDIRDCPHNTTSNCPQNEAAGVICSNSSMPIGSDPGLMKGLLHFQLMIGFLVLVLAVGVAIFIFCFWRKKVLRRATFGGPIEGGDMGYV